MTQITTLNERAAQVRALLTSKKGMARLSAALPNIGIDANRFARMTITALNANPKLYECTIDSLLSCLVLSAQYGLPPTGARGMWLVPFKTKNGLICTPIIDYRGLVTMARRSGHVHAMSAEVVRDGDFFDYEMGTAPFLKFRREADQDAPITHVWASAALSEGPPQFVVLTRAEVDAVKRTSKAGGRGPWVDHFDRMACKTAVRRLCNLLPMQDDDHRLLGATDSEKVGVEMPTIVSAEVTDSVVQAADEEAEERAAIQGEAGDS